MSTKLKRSAIISQADSSYIRLMSQLDSLFESLSSYNRPEVTELPYIIRHELESTVLILGKLPTQLAEVIKSWKAGAEPLLSKRGVEQFILNELLLNMAALHYFFTSQGISMPGVNIQHIKSDWLILKNANRLLS